MPADFKHLCLGLGQPFFKFLGQWFEQGPVKENTIHLHICNDEQKRHLNLLHQTVEVPGDQQFLEQVVEPPGNI